MICAKEGGPSGWIVSRLKKLIPDFIKGEMENQAAKQFLEHVKKCPSCKEELSIQFLVTVGMERLEDGDAFNLNDELSARLQMAGKPDVKIRQRLQRGLYYFESDRHADSDSGYDNGGYYYE